MVAVTQTPTKLVMTSRTADGIRTYINPVSNQAIKASDPEDAWEQMYADGVRNLCVVERDYCVEFEYNTRKNRVDMTILSLS